MLQAQLFRFGVLMWWFMFRLGPMVECGRVRAKGRTVSSRAEVLRLLSLHGNLRVARAYPAGARAILDMV